MRSTFLPRAACRMISHRRTGRRPPACPGFVASTASTTSSTGRQKPCSAPTASRTSPCSRPGGQPRNGRRAVGSLPDNADCQDDDLPGALTQRRVFLLGGLNFEERRRDAGSAGWVDGSMRCPASSLETRLFGSCTAVVMSCRTASSGPEPAIRRRKAAGDRPACVGQLTWVLSLSSSGSSPRCWTTRHGHEGQRRVATNQPMSAVVTRGRARRGLRHGRLVARQHGLHLAMRHFRAHRGQRHGLMV